MRPIAGARSFGATALLLALLVAAAPGCASGPPARAPADGDRGEELLDASSPQDRVGDQEMPPGDGREPDTQDARSDARSREIPGPDPGVVPADVPDVADPEVMSLDAIPPADIDADAPPPFPPPMPVGCVTDVSAGLHHVPCDGLSYEVSVPAACLSAPCGLILDIHGLTMSGDQQDNNTNLRALGEIHGCIVVQPNANPPPPLSSWVTGTDDQKILLFLAAVELAWHVDPKRVHVTGFSQGGLMSWRFVCSQSERFASAAIGGACTYPTQEACAFAGAAMPTRRIPILYMHGKDDTFFLWAAAEAQRDAVLAAWDMDPVETISADAHHDWTRYSGPEGAWFEFLWHDYQATPDVLQGHCYPGSDDPGDEPGQLFSFACTGVSAFVWGEAVMGFFLAHPMP
ncbi:MAG: hypothetical protein FJ098_12175 [Deltaproteobacteria bacterium]|nr:hypothetical protein [Deltaproteobacteria bacterium]